MKVTPGSTDISTFVVLRKTADGTEMTGATITDIDLQYCRLGAAPAAKVDATALAATDSAHADNKAIEIDATDQPGLYRIDWPDAAFASGVREVILSVKLSTCFTEHIRVELETLQTGDSYAVVASGTFGNSALKTLIDAGVDVAKFGGTSVTGRDIGASVLLSSGTGSGQISLSSGTVTVGTSSDKTGYALTSADHTAIADALLKRDWTSVSSEADRSVLNALRHIRNKWTLTGTTLSVKKEDDTTEAWSATVTNDAAALPIIGSDPA